jgi:hypothetical protein
MYLCTSMNQSFCPSQDALPFFVPFLAGFVLLARVIVSEDHRPLHPGFEQPVGLARKGRYEGLVISACA